MNSQATPVGYQPDDDRPWAFTLYISGASPHSATAVETVRRICDEDLRGQAHLDVVDVTTRPATARPQSLWALPTLVKHRPPPLRYLTGGLDDADGVRRRLRLDIATTQPSPTTRER